jgi:hypothetical protein
LKDAEDKKKADEKAQKDAEDTKAKDVADKKLADAAKAAEIEKAAADWNAEKKRLNSLESKVMRDVELQKEATRLENQKKTDLKA